MAQTQQIVPFKEKVKAAMTYFKKCEKQLKTTLPSYITPERWLSVVMRSIQKTPKLLDCTQKSLISAIFQAAQLGLECDGAMGEAYLIPYGKDVVLVPGYPGLLKLVRNTGQLSTIATGAVYEDDEFEFEYGLNPFLKHIPSSNKPGNDPVAYWCAAKLKDGSVHFEVMWPWQVNEIMEKSAGYKAAKKYNKKDNPWIANKAEMGRKTVLRRVTKMLPKSNDLARAIELSDQAEAGETQTIDISDFVTIPEIPEDGNGDNGPSLDSLVDAAQTKQKSEEAPAPNYITKKQVEKVILAGQKANLSNDATLKIVTACGFESIEVITEESLDEVIQAIQESK